MQHLFYVNGFYGRTGANDLINQYKNGKPLNKLIRRDGPKPAIGAARQPSGIECFWLCIAAPDLKNEEAWLDKEVFAKFICSIFCGFFQGFSMKHTPVINTGNIGAGTFGHEVPVVMYLQAWVLNKVATQLQIYDLKLNYFTFDEAPTAFFAGLQKINNLWPQGEAFLLFDFDKFCQFLAELHNTIGYQLSRVMQIKDMTSKKKEASDLAVIVNTFAKNYASSPPVPPAVVNSVHVAPFVTPPAPFYIHPQHPNDYGPSLTLFDKFPDHYYPPPSNTIVYPPYNYSPTLFDKSHYSPPECVPVSLVDSKLKNHLKGWKRLLKFLSYSSPFKSLW
jgi:hypothetical protein